MTAGIDRHGARPGARGWPARRAAKIAVLVVAVIVVLAIAGAVTVSVGGHDGRSAPSATGPLTLRRSPPAAGGFTAVPPLTDSPPDTPIQHTYDQALASGLAGSSTVQAAEAAQVPPPGYSAGWGLIPNASAPDLWASEFVTGLLAVDYAHQSRDGLGRWLSAEEAPELLPGIPPTVAQRVLYLSLFDASAVGQAASPVPDAATWATDARQGVRTSVSDVAVQPDPQLGQLTAQGWQPVDQRFGAEDVTGTITAVSGAGASSKPFSLVVYVGSAHWHGGYGSVLVAGWKTGG